MGDVAVCLVAAPLTARSGVYRSTLELTHEARRRGLPWSALLGVSAAAAGTAGPHPPWVVERTLEPAGLGGLRRVRGALDDPVCRNADVVVSMAPQTDMALATTRRRWVAYLRGLPWPQRGEASDRRRVTWRTLETVALQRAAGVWATTALLRSQVPVRRDIALVPAGIAPRPRRTDGDRAGTRLVWAARFDADKDPDAFLAIAASLDGDAVMYGSGPLRDRCAAIAPSHVRVAGWTDPDALWDDALAYVGTSRREAFGRSAVEAAMAGVPVVLSEAFGAAPLLYTDPDLVARFVLPTADIGRWRAAITALAEDRGLRRTVSDHVHDNARTLTVAASVGRIAARIGGRDPMTIVVLALLVPAGAWLVSRIGLAAAAVVGAITCLAFAGVVSRSLGDVNQLAVGVMIVLAIVLAPRAQLPRAVVVPGAIFLTLATVTAVLAARRSTEFGARGWIALVCAPACMLAVAGLLHPGVLPDGRRLRARAWILGTVVVAIAGNVVFALRQSFFGLSGAEVQAAVSGESTYKVGEQIRLMGTFAGNQDFGLFAACVTPGLLVLSLRTHGALRRVAGAMAGVMYLVTLLSLTRTALIASVAAGIVGILVWGRGSVTARAARLVGTAVVVVGLLTLVVANVNSARVQDSLARADTLFDLGSDGSFRSRSDTNLPYVVGLVEAHPFGLGPGAAGPVSQRFPTVAPAGTVTTDNGYLMIAVQLGLVGAVAFVWMLVALARSLGRSPAPLASAASASLVALLVAMTIAGYWSLLSPIGVVATIIGVAAAHAASVAPPTPVRAPQHGAAHRGARPR